MTRITKKGFAEVSPDLGRRLKALAALWDVKLPEAAARLLERAVPLAEAALPRTPDNDRD